MSTSFFGGAFFNSEFFNSSTPTAVTVFGNLGFFDIGGEEFSDERFKPFREKRERLKAQLIAAYDGPVKSEIDEVITSQLPDYDMAIRLEKILQRMDEMDDEEAILWLM